MKKLLPLSIVMVTFLTACNALGKGRVFNKKTMNYNFGDDFVVKSYDQTVEQKVNLNVPEGETINNSNVFNHFLILGTTSGKQAIYNAYTGEAILPFAEYGMDELIPDNDPSGSEPEIRFFGHAKENDGVKTIDIYDEFGKKVIEGAAGHDFTITRREVDRFDRNGKKDQRIAEVLIETKELKKVVSYNLDGSSAIEDFKTSEYVFEKSFEFTKEGSLKELGYPHLYQFALDGGYDRRYGTYDIKKHKFIAYYDLGDFDETLVLGDYFYTFRDTVVSDENEKYDYYSPTDHKKHDYVVKKVNYLTGKVQDVKVNFYLNGSDPIYGSNGLYQYAGASICEITKDHQLDPRSRTVIFDKNLKVVADISDINNYNIEKHGDKYFDTVRNIAYNDKLEELTRFNYSYVYGNLEMDIVSYFDSLTGKYGLADFEGRSILAANKYTDISELMGGRYIAYADGNRDILKIEKVKGKYTASVLATVTSDYSIDPVCYAIQGTDFILTKDGQRSLLNIKTGAISALEDHSALTPVSLDNSVDDFSGRIINNLDIYQDGTSYVALKSTLTTTFEFGR